MGDPEPHVARPDPARRARLNVRLRQAFIEGAEVDMRRLLGRGLTAEELERYCGTTRVTCRTDGSSEPKRTERPGALEPPRFAVSNRPRYT